MLNLKNDLYVIYNQTNIANINHEISDKLKQIWIWNMTNMKQIYKSFSFCVNKLSFTWTFFRLLGIYIYIYIYIYLYLYIYEYIFTYIYVYI